MAATDAAAAAAGAPEFLDGDDVAAERLQVAKGAGGRGRR
jgi:hypothetical protein